MSVARLNKNFLTQVFLLDCHNKQGLILLWHRSYSVVGFVLKSIQKLGGKITVSPSEAVIDQTLPPELIEHIFLSLDCTSIAACSLVSKYWNHYATNEQIQEHVIEKFYQRSIEELKIILAEKVPSFDLKTVKWRTYPSSYPRKLILEDRMLAAKAGKFFLDLDTMDEARKINYALAPRIESNRDDVSKFLVKVHGKFYYDPDPGELHIQTLQNHWTQLTLNSYQLGDPSASYRLVGKECDAILEFDQAHNQYTDLHSVKIRVLDRLPVT